MFVFFILMLNTVLLCKLCEHAQSFHVMQVSQTPVQAILDKVLHNVMKRVNKLAGVEHLEAMSSAAL